MHHITHLRKIENIKKVWIQLQSTRAGMLCDDRERFLRFKQATEIMTKSKGASEEVEKLCEQMKDSLSTLSSLMKKVVST